MRTYGNRPSSIEILEIRRHLSTTMTSWGDNDIVYLPGYNYEAQLQIGDDGYPGGVPGATLSIAGTETGSTGVIWGDMSDGLDSGWHGVQFSVNTASGGEADLSVGNSGSDVISSTSTGTLSQVAITAGVDEWGLSMQWQDIQVDFYSGTTLVDSASIPTMGVDTTNADTNDPAEAITQISTNAQNVTKVVVTGQVRMTANAGVYPANTDIFAQVQVT
jgi:hypothetical protein